MNLSPTSTLSLEVQRLSERPELFETILTLDSIGYPAFLQADAASLKHWVPLHEVVPQLQFAVVDTERDRVVACGHAAWCFWDGSVEGLPESWDEALAQGVTIGGSPTGTVCALSIVVDPQSLGLGLSKIALRALRESAAALGATSLLAPVRPNAKSSHPMVSMTEYLTWRRPDGYSTDPWLRTHERLGGTILKVAERSMVVHGSVSDWKHWTGVDMDGPGDHVVPGALVPVHADGHGSGEYIEPNVWVHHDLVRGTL